MYVFSLYKIIFNLHTFQFEYISIESIETRKILKI